MNKGLLAEKARLTKELEDIRAVEREATNELEGMLQGIVCPYPTFVYSRFLWDTRQPSPHLLLKHLFVSSEPADFSICFDSIDISPKKKGPNPPEENFEIKLCINNDSVMLLTAAQLRGKEFHIGKIHLTGNRPLSFELADGDDSDFDLIMHGYVKIGIPRDCLLCR